jgi:hypothetical protein
MEKFRLKTAKSKSRVRLHIVSFVVFLFIALAVGFVVGQQSPDIAGAAVKEACIPQSEFEYFLTRYNALQEDYQGCVRDAWALQLICKQNGAKFTQPNSNTTN